MDCDLAEAKKTCSLFMQKFDDYQQKASDAGRKDLIPYFVEAYNLLDKYYHSLTDENALTIDIRNDIRMTIKFTQRLAGSELLVKEIS